MINVIYGVLTMGSADPSMAGFRYSDVTPTGKQRSTLAGLLRDKTETRLLFVDYIIKLLSCSPMWTKLIREVDPNNTYDVDVIDKHTIGLILGYSPMERLVEWEKSINIINEHFPYTELDPVTDRITAKLAAVLMLSEDKNG